MSEDRKPLELQIDIIKVDNPTEIEIEQKVTYGVGSSGWLNKKIIWAVTNGRSITISNQEDKFNV